MLQRQLSSFDIRIIVDELQQFTNQIIEKSYQVSHHEIIIKIKNIQTKEKSILYIKNGEFLTITKKSFHTPKTPSNFIMALRKYIQNGRILSVSQHEFDRIVSIQIGKKTGTFTLVIEFFSDGNIILVDPDGKIIIPFIHQTWAHRKLKGRQPYRYPPSQINPFSLSYEEFCDIIKESTSDIVRTLAVKLNLSGVYAEEICYRSNLDKQRQTSELTQEELKILFSTLQKMIHRFQTRSFQPMVVNDQENRVDIIPFPFQSYTQYSMNPVIQFIQGLDSCIQPEKTNKLQQKTESKTEKTIGKLKRMLAQQQEKVKILGDKIQTKKREGELIYLHFNTVDHLLKTVQHHMNEKDKTQTIEMINNMDIVKTFHPEKNSLIITLSDTEDKQYDIPLLFRKSVSENAEHAYAESKKSLKKKQGAEKSLEKTQKNLDQILLDQKNEQRKVEQQEHIVKKKKKHYWFEQYRWTISSKGNLIIGGKDAKTNEQLIKKHMEKHDRYVHADIHGAPSCLVKQKTLDEKPLDITEDTLNEACVFATCYSKAWKQFSEAQAYWVLPQQVSKTPQSGEFVPKGAFIIRGNRNYCKCILEMGIGQLDINEETRWIGGSISAIKKWCETYIIIKPGGLSRKDFSHMIAKQTKTSSDDINQILPPGGISIIQTKGITLETRDGGGK